MNIMKILLYFIAIILTLGGIMGVIKAFVPDLEWLNIRYIINGNSTYTLGETPLYARIYGTVLAIMELLAAITIFRWRKRMFPIAILTFIISMVGCMIAIIIGDFLALFSFCLRIVPIYLLVKEYKTI